MTEVETAMSNAFTAKADVTRISPEKPVLMPGAGGMGIPTEEMIAASRKPTRRPIRPLPRLRRRQDPDEGEPEV